ncbi:MAG: hypothetical protein ABII13_01395 [Patescibacteria group bacterium]
MRTIIVELAGTAIVRTHREAERYVRLVYNQRPEIAHDESYLDEETNLDAARLVEQRQRSVARRWYCEYYRRQPRNNGQQARTRFSRETIRDDVAA